jgi:endonuclease-3 related protein
MSTRKQLIDIYHRLSAHFGPQRWWPAQSPLEVMVGAVLTQNTNWKNVEKAIANLKQAGLLDAGRLYQIDPEDLAQFIRPAGYYNLKALRLKALIAWLWETYGGDLQAICERPADLLREQLLAIRGIGPETADSILLYALDKPVFVVDAYTARILGRHRLISPPADYSEIQSLFENALPREVRLYNEYHALLVCCGKEFCRPKARCDGCPLNPLPHDIEENF